MLILTNEKSIYITGIAMKSFYLALVKQLGVSSSYQQARPLHLKHLILARQFLFSTLMLSFCISSEAKTLTVLTWSGNETYLPRAGYPQDLEIEYLQRFSQENGLELERKTVTDFDQLIPMLLAGEGDIIAANLTITSERKEKVRFTQPFIQTQEMLLMGKKSKKLKTGKDLNGREVVVQSGKTFARTAQGLAKVYPGLKIRTISADIGNEALYDRLASGEYDLAIQDKNVLQSALQYRTDIKASLQASGKRNIAWATHPENKTLHKDLNHFLQEQNLAKTDIIKAKTYWQQIKKNKTIRFVLRNNLSSYYIWRGELLGFNYELAKKFAKEHQLRYEIIVAPDNASMLNYLKHDKADIALGFLTPTATRKSMGIAFSRPYHYATELLVSQSNQNTINSIEDLHNHTIFTRKSSSYWDTAEELQKNVKDLTLTAVPETMETESIITQVANGYYDLTIADSHIVDMELTFRDDIQSVMALGEKKPQSWAIKKGHNELLKHVDTFIKKHYRGLFYNVTYNKYFKNQQRLDKHRNDYVNQKASGEISPYDNIIKKYATKYNFDWRLMVAQMHRESRFNPTAKSFAGARGLFQVMPRTAKELGILNLKNPEDGIHAGIRYMDWVRERMQKNNIPEEELIWFTLACYNAGTGHVRDAMRLAKKKGWKSDVWFGHVEKAMLLLSKREYASKARYGYVRGEEPVKYVREIKRSFESYQHISTKS